MDRSDFTSAQPRAVADTARPIASVGTRFTVWNSRLIAALAATYLLWGTSYLALKHATVSFPPLLLAGVRNLIAGGLMLLLAWLLGRNMGTWRCWGNAALVGILMIAAGSSLLARGIPSVASGTAAVLFAALPVIVCVVLATLGQHVGRMQWMGTAIGVAGVLLLSGDALATPGQRGMWLIMAAVFATAIGAVLADRTEMPEDILVSTAVQMFAGGAVASMLGWLLGERIGAVTPQAMAGFLYLGLFVSIVGYLSYVYVLTHAGAVAASSYAYVNPPVALLAGAWLLGEVPSPTALVATAVVLAGAITVLAFTPRAPPREPTLSAFSHSGSP
jgi:drug/metabolite transporter (DMT)-like permease